MEEGVVYTTEMVALECLGKGFDLTSDFRLKFAKGVNGGKRLVVLDEENKRDIMVPGGATIRDVSEDIRCDKGDRIRFKSDVLEFNQVGFLFFLFGSSFFLSSCVCSNMYTTLFLFTFQISGEKYALFWLVI